MVTTEQYEDVIQEYLDKYQDGPDAVRVNLKVSASSCGKASISLFDNTGCS